jgi:hypothetical protein
MAGGSSWELSAFFLGVWWGLTCAQRGCVWQTHPSLCKFDGYGRVVQFEVVTSARPDRHTTNLTTARAN